jgi:hypothetical protein
VSKSLTVADTSFLKDTHIKEIRTSHGTKQQQKQRGIAIISEVRLYAQGWLRANGFLEYITQANSPETVVEGAFKGEVSFFKSNTTIT